MLRTTAPPVLSYAALQAVVYAAAAAAAAVEWSCARCYISVCTYASSNHAEAVIQKFDMILHP